MDKFEEKATPAQIEKEYKEAIDIFPALHKYQSEHNAINLKKLCNEVSEFCSAIYASTQNEAERQIYRNFTQKLNK